MARAKLTALQRAVASEQSLAYYYRHKDLVNERAAQYRERTKEAIAERGRLYSLANAESIKERKRLYRIKNKEKTAAQYLEKKERVQASCAAYYAVNSDQVKENVKAWRKANPDKARVLSANKRAIKRAAGGKLSIDIAARLMALQKNRCPVCLVDLVKTGYHLDHIEPLSKGGAHTDFNVQLLCQKCNLEKHAKHPVDFMQSRGFLL